MNETEETKICIHCGEPFTRRTREGRARFAKQRKCSRSCSKDRLEVERFWSHVDISQAGECWLWSGPLNNMGYGRFRVYEGKTEKRVLAHRYSLSLVEPLVKGLVILHTCDTPRCVNPAHMRQGSQGDNIRDALRKGRLNTSGLDLGRKGRKKVKTP